MDGASGVDDGAGVGDDAKLDGEADFWGGGFDGWTQETAAIVCDGDEFDLVSVENLLEGGDNVGVDGGLGTSLVVGDKHREDGKRHESGGQRETKNEIDGGWVGVLAQAFYKYTNGVLNRGWFTENKATIVAWWSARGFFETALLLLLGRAL
jgi:hypothetical protein